MNPSANLALDERTPARTALTNETAARYLPRVRRYAAHMARKHSGIVTAGDLVSAGLLGLVDAFIKVDADRFAGFEAYVDHRIRGAILDELRDRDPLTRDQRAFDRQHEEARAELVRRNGRAPVEAELAAELGMELTLYRQRVACLPGDDGDAEAMFFAGDPRALVDDADDAPERLTASRETSLRVRAAMRRLTARQRAVLQLHYDQEHTKRTIAATLGVSESRVSQIHGEAIRALRKALGEEG